MAYASFAGGTLAAILLAATAPLLAKVSLSFVSTNYFALMLLGLCLVSAFSSQGEYLKALMMTCFGLMLSTVGTDLSAGAQRFTFGRMELIDGISFLMLAMATFALSEALMIVLRRGQREDVQTQVDGSQLRLSLAEVTFVAPTITRSSLLVFMSAYCQEPTSYRLIFSLWRRAQSGVKNRCRRIRQELAKGVGSARISE